MDRSFQLLDDIMKAESGDTASMRKVAFYLLYENNMEDLEDEIAERILEYLRDAIEAGDPDAMMDLGGMYITGRGVPKDRDKALYWYGKAAELEHPPAFNRIGQVYLYDEDTEGLGYLPSTDDPDRLRRAFEYFGRGAALGEAGCMTELGIMYMNGECTEPDAFEGFRWFQKAYASSVSEPGDHAQAAYELAECYHYGAGAEKDLETALEYAKGSRAMNEQDYREGHPGSHYFVEQATLEIQKIIAEMEGDLAGPEQLLEE